MNLFGGEACLSKTAKSSAQIAALNWAGRTRVLVELQGETAAFAVVRLGEVDELEVKPEGSCELIGGGKIECVYASKRLFQMRCGGGLVDGSGLRSFGFAAGDGDATQSFYGLIERLTSLLAQHLAEQHAQRANITA